MQAKWLRPSRLWWGLIGFGLIFYCLVTVRLYKGTLSRRYIVTLREGEYQKRLREIRRPLLNGTIDMVATVSNSSSNLEPFSNVHNITVGACAAIPHSALIQSLPYRPWNSSEYKCKESPAKDDQDLSFHWQQHIDSYTGSNYYKQPPLGFSPHYRAPCMTVALKVPSTGSRPVFCFPSVHVAGFQKAGTSDLTVTLAKHPQIEVGDNKEQHFWAQGFHKGLLGYSRMFSKAHSKLHQWCTKQRGKEVHTRMLLDESPSTLWKPYKWYDLNENINQSLPSITSAQSMYNLFPNNSIIGIVRDPVERLYSEYLYRHRTVSRQDFHRMATDIVKWFSECGKQHSMKVCGFSKELYLKIDKQYSLQPVVGYYFLHLEHWMKAFPREQIYVVRLEDYKQNRSETARRIFRFLNLPDPPKSVYDNMDTQTVANSLRSRVTRRSSKYIGDMLPETRTLLRDFYRPLNAELACLLGDQSFTWGY